MLKKLNALIYAYIVIIIFVAVIFYQTLRLHFTFSKIIPFFLCVLVFILTVIGIINEVYKIKQNAGTAEKKGDAPGSKTQKGMLVCTIPVFILAFLIYTLGFWIATPLFISVYIKYNGGRWLEAITTAVITTGTIYVVFELILKAHLYPGMLFLY